jgi:hypothetical protein
MPRMENRDLGFRIEQSAFRNLHSEMPNIPLFEFRNSWDWCETWSYGSL